MKRPVAGLCLMLGAAFALAAGCGSADKKNARRDSGGEAGVGGETEIGQAKGGAPSSGGAGAGGVDAAGDSGAPQIAGGVGGESAGGAAFADAGETSSGGFPAVECTPSGDVTALSYSASTVTVCRDAVAILNFSIEASDQQFVCCGTSSAGYSFEAGGVADNDGGGYLSYRVPSTTQLGAETLSLTCASGAIATPVSINVTNTAPPVVTSVPPAVAGDAPIPVTGTNLAGVNNMLIVPTDPTLEQYYCNVDHQTQTDTFVECRPAGAPNGTYRVVVMTARCAAVNSPVFNIADF